MKNDKVIIKGSRMPNGLWSLLILESSSHQAANGILHTDKRSKQEFSTYLHITFGSPLPSTLLGAIRHGHLTGYLSRPDYKSYLQALPKSLATILGH